MHRRTSRRPSTRPRTTAALGAGLALAMTAALPATASPAEPGPSDGVAERSTRALEPVAPRSAAPTSPSAAERRGTGSRTFAKPVPRNGPARDAVLDASLDRLVDDGAVGVVARVDRPGRDYAGAAGVRDRTKPATAREGDRFRVASNTKSMVAVLVMRQVERGTWSLGTTVDEVLPGALPGHGDVTVEQLLSHTSGLQTGTDVSLLRQMDDPSSWDDFFAATGADYADEQLVADAAALPWGPRGQHLYSNAGYVLLGMMLREETGRDIGQLLRTEVFRPAGMTRSSFATRVGTPGPMLVGASSTSQGWYSEAGFNPDLFSSAGAVISTTRDLGRFTKAVNDGTLLKTSTVREMQVPRDETGWYGLGIYRLPDPCTPKGAAQRYLYGHDGGSYGTTSMALSSPDGRRQVTLGVTGRYFSETDPTQAQPFDLLGLYTQLARATC
ncbi:beta-lactamase family protein [Janibacter melonis]|uniref:serine hydrolase domain-containing protein n=1 Tax=Janibacter melonis TaxID=262209 RepID=UPI002043E697|nr:serine hydrolase domain-containing protein [Janibacter melonis]MCM3555566.1 beta-lactamase family protein [Janibacter melonis]